MNEFLRTLIYVGVGTVAAIVAYASRPQLERPETGVVDTVGKKLFERFSDPTAAASLQITQYDESTARVKTFTVAQQANGQWVIPSHGGYPADAETQLRAVAESLSDLRILGVIDDAASEHGRFGVRDPSQPVAGETGFGTLVTMQDNKGNDLLKMIVGKQDADKKELRFVRKPTEEVIYVVKIDLEKLPTQFDKWIEKDLLKINTWDVAKVTIKDYLLLPTQQGSMAYVPRMETKVSYASDKGEWTLDEMLVYRGQRPQPSPLGEQEELNRQKLDDLRNGLGDLKIVDVVKKPEGLGNSLQVNKDKLTEEQKEQLRDFGFFPNPRPDGSLDIFGTNGEVVVDTKDGVQYVLRFGDIAPQVEVSSSSTRSDADKAKSDDEQVKVNRYLFVMTQLAPSILTPPQLEPEPAGPVGQTSPADADKKEDAAAQTDAKKVDESASEEKKDEQKPPTVDPQQAERERIRKENERKMNEYRDKKTKAENRVRELNARFADWYYVVSEDVYKKIRLVRSDIVKEKESAKEEGFGIDAFRKLESEGLKPAAKP